LRTTIKKNLFLRSADNKGYKCNEKDTQIFKKNLLNVLPCNEQEKVDNKRDCSKNAKCCNKQK